MPTITPSLSKFYSTIPKGPQKAYRATGLQSDVYFASKPKPEIIVIDVGTNEIKIYTLLTDGSFGDRRIPIGDGPGVEYLEALKTRLHTIYKDIPDGTRVVAVGTAGLRREGDKGDELASTYGITIIPGEFEGLILRESILLDKAADPDNIIFEVGGGSTEIAFADYAQNIVLDYGTKSDTPYDLERLAELKAKAMADIQEKITKEEMAGKTLYMSPKDVFQTIEARRRHSDALPESMSREDLAFYLTNEGIQLLQDYQTEHPESNYISLIPARVAILLGFMEATGIQTILYGHEGGLKAGLMRRELHNQDPLSNP